MEPIPMGSSPNYGEWDPLSLLFTNEDLDLTQRLLGHGPPAPPHHHQGLDGTVEFEIPADYYVFPSYEDQNLANHTVMSGICGSFLVPTPSFSPNYCNSGESFVPDFAGILARESLSHDHNMGNNIDACADREASAPEVKRVQPKRKGTKSKPCNAEADDTETDAPQNSKKRKPRATKEKVKKTTQPKKEPRLAKPADTVVQVEDGNIEVASQDQGHGLSPGSSDLAGSDSQDHNNNNNGECSAHNNSDEASALNSDGKTTRASRGAATDPQSLYARRRRERINERLRILQNLVPNGTKVDISTMLEEAVHYVKFLQLQIKLLSSDELWMYAPIAYNGMDIGLNKILPSQLL